MNENKLAWIITGGALGTALASMLMFAMFSPAGVAGRGASENNETVSQYASMFQERNRLQARVNFCERQKQGDIPAYRRACDEAEIEKLNEYRARIVEIDTELKKLRDTPLR